MVTTRRPDPKSAEYKAVKKRVEDMRTVKGASKTIARAHKKAWERLKNA